MALFLDVEATTLSAEECDMLQHPLVKGVVLFSRNYVEPSQLQALCGAIKKSRADLLIAVDQEGGRVQRFRKGMLSLPSLGSLGRLHEQNPQLADETITAAAWLMANEVMALGVDFSFAPVLDLNNPLSQVIADRALHSDPPRVSQLGITYLNGLRSAGIAAVAKHFPGHGFVTADSHISLPQDERSFAELEHADLQPFLAAIHWGVEALMSAHIVYPNIDQLPATFSPFWLKKILRETWQFQGVIFSDDLSMQGACFIADPIHRVASALKAGCDVALLCNDRVTQIKVLDQLPYQENPLLQQRLLALKPKNTVQWQALHKSASFLYYQKKLQLSQSMM